MKKRSQDKSKLITPTTFVMPTLALIKKQHAHLLAWYRENKRELPWRKAQNPYHIWLSEVMLQQTTVAAVLPYFEKFIAKFKTVNDLAAAPLSEVLELWAGLGYYSRARNLHASAQALALHGFPKSAHELMKLKGFGPYTSRAVSSIAFNEPVGVVDGNVIRVFSRVYNFPVQHWLPKERDKLQIIADAWAEAGQPSEINQALMELGATVCTPHSPQCVLCPLRKNCEAQKQNIVSQLPLKKPRREREIWIWHPQIHLRKDQIALTNDHNNPFLKNQLLPPGEIFLSKKKPSSWSLRHSITHHDIYVCLDQQPALQKQKSRQLKWIPLDELSKHSQTSVLKKIVQVYKKEFILNKDDKA